MKLTMINLNHCKYAIYLGSYLEELLQNLTSGSNLLLSYTVFFISFLRVMIIFTKNKL